MLNPRYRHTSIGPIDYETTDVARSSSKQRFWILTGWQLIYQRDNSDAVGRSSRDVPEIRTDAPQVLGTA